MLKLKIKKCGLVRKVDGVKTNGFYGRVITNGKISFSDVAVESAKNTTLQTASPRPNFSPFRPLLLSIAQCFIENIFAL